MYEYKLIVSKLLHASIDRSIVPNAVTDVNLFHCYRFLNLTQDRGSVIDVTFGNIEAEASTIVVVDVSNAKSSRFNMSDCVPTFLKLIVPKFTRSAEVTSLPPLNVLIKNVPNGS